jgi:hypothetical protein
MKEQGMLVKREAMVVVRERSEGNPGHVTDFYAEVVRRGIPHDSHESDLYIPVTPETEEMVRGYPSRSNVTRFRSNIDGKMWFDVPFAYTPWWERRQGKRTEENPRSPAEGQITKALVQAAIRRIFTPAAQPRVEDADALGIMVSQYLGWDGHAIVRALSSALEDANFHQWNAKIREMFAEAFTTTSREHAAQNPLMAIQPGEIDLVLSNEEMEALKASLADLFDSGDPTDYAEYGSLAEWEALHAKVTDWVVNHLDSTRKFSQREAVMMVRNLEGVEVEEGGFYTDAREAIEHQMKLAQKNPRHRSSSNSHTPGPWSVASTQAREIIYERGIIARPDLGLPRAEVEANARLIASSPRLLEFAEGTQKELTAALDRGDSGRIAEAAERAARIAGQVIQLATRD